MSEFLKGWRRKAGGVTLVMACVLLAGWIRSATVCDEVSCHLFGDRHYMISGDGQLMWATDRQSKVFGGLRLSTARITNFDDRDLPFDSNFLLSRWRHALLVVEFGLNEVEGTGMPGLPRNLHWCRIQYQSIVAILTLTSTYLILWTSQKRA